MEPRSLDPYFPETKLIHKKPKTASTHKLIVTVAFFSVARAKSKNVGTGSKSQITMSQMYVIKLFEQYCPLGYMSETHKEIVLHVSFRYISLLSICTHDVFLESFNESVNTW